MNLSDRLKLARTTSGKEQKEIAALLGISFRSWQDYELGKSVPGGKVFEALVGLGFNANWLLTGEGPMRLGEPEPATKASLYANAADLEHEYVLVPRYDVTVSAGGGALAESEQVVDHLAFKARWIHAMRLNPANLLLVNTMGDSMYPTIKEGDLLLVDKGQRDVRIDAIYILRNDGALVAKRLQRLDDGSIRIKSDNKAYDPQVVPPERVPMLNIIGRVVWGGGRM